MYNVTKDSNLNRNYLKRAVSNMEMNPRDSKLRGVLLDDVERPFPARSRRISDTL